ncbi:hypothetical protein BaRGS_00030379 [Batillaria attramentaria]|uniref:Uncharacterized protein n=1 Tax=Batillaria attramentaria TaxID=370345 RepID=A0ABD0JUM0_9CAEN
MCSALSAGTVVFERLPRSSFPLSETRLRRRLSPGWIQGCSAHGRDGFGWPEHCKGSQAYLTFGSLVRKSRANTRVSSCWKVSELQVLQADGWKPVHWSLEYELEPRLSLES